VSVDYASIAVELPDLSDLVDGLRAGQEECEAFFGELLAEWEQVSDQVMAALATGADRATEHDSRLEQVLSLLEQSQKAWNDEIASLDARRDAVREEAWDQRRRELENELEAARRRAAELAESLEQQNLERTQQQLVWTDELAHIRCLLEDLSQRPKEAAQTDDTGRESPDEQPTEAPPVATKTVEADPTDPVLDSVLAQFEMLQRDVARRRTHKH